MPTFSETVYVDVELEDFDDRDIIEYVEEELGYTVTKNEPVDRDMSHVIWEYKYGQVIEAVKLLEKAYPELEGLHKKFV
jgi:uncharacterized protein (DUF2164 family)